MDLTKYDIVVGAFKARMVFRSELEYRKALAVTFETLSKKGEGAEIEGYYNVLNEQCLLCMPLSSLERVMEEYAEASALYLSIDWGDRSQAASRKRFCRMMFRHAATGEKVLEDDEVTKFRTKDADERLLSIFFPNGVDRAPRVNIIFFLLFAFDVIKPLAGIAQGEEGARSRQNKDISDKQTLTSLSNLRDMITTLCEDTPRMGSTDKPLVFSISIANIDQFLSNPEDLDIATPLWMVGLLNGVLEACQSLVSPKNTRDMDEFYTSLNMPGIWIDNGEGNADRFWVFPDNMEHAFCYEWRKTEWVLTPYSFSCILTGDLDQWQRFLFLPSKYMMDVVRFDGAPIKEDLLANGGCKISLRDGSICRVEFFEDGMALPNWFKWRSLDRLERDDPRYEGFREVLEGIYNPEDTLSAAFTNSAPLVTDSPNCLIGRDREYLYVSDIRRPEKGRMRASADDEDRFIYEEVYLGGRPPLSLFSLEISEEHPLYAIPLRLRKHSNRRNCWWKLEELLKYVERVDEAYIYPAGKMRVLYFPKDYVIVPLDEKELEEYGIRIYKARLR